MTMAHPIDAHRDIARSEALHRAMVEHQRDLVSLSSIDGELIYVNKAYALHFGRDAAALVGSNLFAGVDTADLDDARQQMDAVFATGVTQQKDFRTVDASGHARWVSWTHSLMHDIDGTPMLHAVGRDVTDRRLLEQALADQERFLRRMTDTMHSVTEAIPAMVGVVGVDRRYRFVNGAFARWNGHTVAEIMDQPMADVLGPALYERSLPYVDRALAGETVVFEKEAGGRNPDQHLSITYVPLWQQGETGEVVDGFVSVVLDVTQQKREESRLKRLLRRDKLTGLLNRAGLESYVDEVVRKPEADLTRIALLYVDMDRFKPVNDMHGHAAGDELLRLFSRRLARLVRPTDAVVRLGGDEFAVVLTGVADIQGVRLVADKIVAMAGNAFVMGQIRVEIGASIGFALGLDNKSGWAGLMKRADDMLYRAKQSGRGRACGADDAVGPACDAANPPERQAP